MRIRIDHEPRLEKLEELHRALTETPEITFGQIHEVLVVLLEEALEARGDRNEQDSSAGDFRHH
jgi:hypothetical protein